MRNQVKLKKEVIFPLSCDFLFQVFILVSPFIKVSDETSSSLSFRNNTFSSSS